MSYPFFKCVDSMLSKSPLSPSWKYERCKYNIRIADKVKAQNLELTHVFGAMPLSKRYKHAKHQHQ